MLLSALMFLALALWWHGHTARTGRAAGWFSVFWITLALAVLTKGPVAAVLVLGTIGAYALLCGQLRALFCRPVLVTAPLFVLVAAPWFLLVAQRNPEFNRIFWYEQHVGRFLGLGEHKEHEQPFAYFLEFMPALFFPWSLFVPGAVALGWRCLWPPRTERQRALVFLLTGAASIVLFFSVSSGKLLPYVLPAMPLLALALAAVASTASGIDAKPRSAAHCGAASCWRFSPWRCRAWRRWLTRPALCARSAPRTRARRGVLRAAAGLGGGRRGRGPATPRGAARRERGRRLRGAHCVGDLHGAGHRTNHYCESLIDDIELGLRHGAGLVAYDSYLPSMGFYARRRLVAIDGYGELEPGILQLRDEERARWFPEGLEAARAALDRPEPVYCFVRDHTGPGAGPAARGGHPGDHLEQAARDRGQPRRRRDHAAAARRPARPARCGPVRASLPT